MSSRIVAEVTAGPEKGRRAEFHGGAFRIGRSEGVELSLDKDLFVGRIHARVTLDGDRLLVEDLDSTNGTYAGWRRVRGSHRLRSGRSIRVGDSRIRLDVLNSPHASSARLPRLLAAALIVASLVLFIPLWRKSPPPPPPPVNPLREARRLRDAGDLAGAIRIIDGQKLHEQHDNPVQAEQWTEINALYTNCTYWMNRFAEASDFESRLAYDFAWDAWVQIRQELEAEDPLRDWIERERIEPLRHKRSGSP